MLSKLTLKLQSETKTCRYILCIACHLFRPITFLHHNSWGSWNVRFTTRMQNSVVTRKEFVCSRKSRILQLKLHLQLLRYCRARVTETRRRLKKQETQKTCHEDLIASYIISVIKLNRFRKKQTIIVCAWENSHSTKILKDLLSSQRLTAQLNTGNSLSWISFNFSDFFFVLQ